MRHERHMTSGLLVVLASLSFPAQAIESYLDADESDPWVQAYLSAGYNCRDKIPRSAREHWGIPDDGFIVARDMIDVLPKHAYQANDSTHRYHVYTVRSTARKAVIHIDLSLDEARLNKQRYVYTMDDLTIRRINAIEMFLNDEEWLQTERDAARTDPLWYVGEHALDFCRWKYSKME